MEPTNLTPAIITWLITGLSLAAAHWFPAPRRLGRLENYIIGTLCLNAPFTGWLLLVYGNWTIVVVLWVNLIVGGSVVALAWGYDYLLRYRIRANVAEKAVDDARAE